MTNFAIETIGLRKQFGKKTAVSNLTLQVKRGEIFGFLGPNGAGKTTSIKMLLGLTAPTAGSASLLGQPLGDRLTRAKIGFLPEHFRFHEWLKAAEFLDLHGRLQQMSAAARRQTIPELLHLVGLQDRAETPLRAFSKGMLQRIGLAQALLNQPELLFLDEPTSGLDPLGRRLVRDVINQMRQQGTAVFLNSHLLSEVEQTCDRVTFIRQGEILETVMLNEQTAAVPVVVRVGQPTPEFLAQLGEFWDEVTFVGENGRIHLTLPNETDIPKLANWLIGQGHTLYELTPQPITLEERFLQIVGNGK
ncbi:MAG: ABC transporter ATP-binding protein [Chloroflexi bacterium]|nr:ABC transporter ATP-binding protein [Chloroflexota bacterium]